MFQFRQEQFDALKAAHTSRLRRAWLESLSAQGINGTEDPNSGHMTLVDRSGALAELIPTDTGMTLVSGEGRRFDLKYDQEGRIDSIREPSGQKVLLTRNQRGQLTGIERGAHSRYIFAYDSAGHLSSIRYPDETTLQLVHSPAGSLMEWVDRRGRRTRYRYSNTGQLKQQCDPKGNVTTFEHDGTDGPSALVFPNGERHEFGYDSKGNLSTIHINGREHARIVSKRPGEARADFHDGASASFSTTKERLVRAANETCTLELEYDESGRIRRERYDGQVVVYLRNEVGALISLELSDGTKLEFERDQEHRVTAIKDWEGQRYALEYADNGALQRVQYPNGAQTIQDTDELGRISRVRVLSPGYDAQPVYASEATYDLCDRVIQEVELDCTRRFGYDDGGRLTSVASTHPQEREYFELDENGNCLQARFGACQYNAADQLTSVSSLGFEYDEQGNMRSFPTPTGRT